MTDKFDAFLNALTRRIDIYVETFGPEKLLSARALSKMLRGAHADLAEQFASVEHWSEWLEWGGGPCPLPSGTQCLCEMRDSDIPPHIRASESWFWPHEDRGHDIIRFRYRCAPDGWVERGDWIPPTELWRDDCPVRCEWTRGMDAAKWPGTHRPEEGWTTVTHIRLAARGIAEAAQPVAVPELPEFVDLDRSGEWAIRLQYAPAIYVGRDACFEDLDRIAEAASILAARRRAGL